MHAHILGACLALKSSSLIRWVAYNKVLAELDSEETSSAANGYAAVQTFMSDTKRPSSPEGVTQLRTRVKIEQRE
jgi:hypothetical protein